MTLDSLQSSIFTTALLLARILGVFIFAPGFSMKATPKRFKVLLAIALSALLTTYIDYEVINTPYELITYICCEFLAGVSIGLISNLFMYAIQTIGEVIDSLLGTGMFKTESTSNTTSSVTSKILEYIGLLVFFASNSHLYLIYVITRESNFINIFKAFENGGVLNFIVEIFHFIFINGVHLSIPFVLVFLLIDICLGIMNRSFSSFNIFLFSMPVKMMLFIVILLYYLAIFTSNLQNLMNMNIDFLNSFILFLNPR